MSEKFNEIYDKGNDIPEIKWLKVEKWLNWLEVTWEYEVFLVSRTIKIDWKTYYSPKSEFIVWWYVCEIQRNEIHMKWIHRSVIKLVPVRKK